MKNAAPIMPFAHYFEFRLILLCGIMVSGCSPSPSNQTEDKADAQPKAIAEEKPSIVPTPNWPALPTSDFENAKRDWVLATKTELDQVQISIPNSEELISENWNYKERIDFLVGTLSDFRSFNSDVDAACADAMKGMCQRISEFVIKELAAQEKTNELLDTRLKWYDENNAAAPEIAEFRELKKQSQNRIEVLKQCVSELNNSAFDNCKSTSSHLQSMGTVQKQMPDVYELLQRSVHMFQQSHDRSTLIAQSLAEWGRTDIEPAIRKQDEAEARLQQDLNAEQLRFDRLQKVINDDRAGLEVSDEDWQLLQTVGKALSKEKPPKILRGGFDACKRLGIVAEYHLATNNPRGVGLPYGAEGSVETKRSDKKLSTSEVATESAALLAALQSLLKGSQINELKHQLAVVKDKRSALLEWRNKLEAAVQGNSAIAVGEDANAAQHRAAATDAPPTSSTEGQMKAAGNDINANSTELTGPNPTSSNTAISPVTNSLGMGFALIPSGEFLMGSPNDEQGRNTQEQQHKVTLTNSYLMGVNEVTQEQYAAVMGQNPSALVNPSGPVENVDWNDARQFCKKLSAMPAEMEAKRTYRLPTEAEWEYACRAGNRGAYSFGDSRESLVEYSTFSKNSEGRPASVQSRKPNPFGLYDMHGNVYEWCEDAHAPYRTGKLTDPKVTSGPTGDNVLRGGSFKGSESDIRSASRGWAPPKTKSSEFGFRVVLSQAGNP